MSAALRVGIAVVTASGVLALSGCTPPEVRPIAAPSAVKNQAQWSLPLDPYFDQSGFDEAYAEQVLIAPCLAVKGMDWPVAYQPSTTGANGTTNAAGRKIFNATVASTYGYHQAATFDLPGFEEAKRVRDRPIHLTPAQDDDFVSCLDAARKLMGTETEPAQVASGLAAEAYDETKASHAVTSATSRWLACMAPIGVSDLGTDPTDMPSQSLAAEFGLNGDGDDGAPPSAREVEIAVADARCQVDSGYADAFYEGEWRAQERLLADNADELERSRAQILSKAERIDEVLTGHAPERP